MKRETKGTIIRERIVLTAYGIYTSVMAAVVLAMEWESWITPLILLGFAASVVMHLRRFRSYTVRSVFTSLMCWINISIYLVKVNDFMSALPIIAAVIVLTAVYGDFDIIKLGTILYTLHIIYHQFYVRDIHMTIATLGGLRTCASIGAIYLVFVVCLLMIKTQEETNITLSGYLETLTNAQNDKDDFLANMSHEIRTPINTICGLSEIVLSGDLPEEARESVVNIQNSGKALLSIVSDILDFTELTSGKMDIVPGTYNINSVVSDVINMISPAVFNKKLELIADVDATIPAGLIGDEQKLRRAVMNIVDNAVKFTKEGGIILACYTRREIYGVNLVISVRDTGIGMDAESLEKLFTSYNQVDTKRNRQERGLGLGLPISKAIVNKMGGFISVKSELGKGTEVQMVIPQRLAIEEPSVTVRDVEKVRIALYIDMNKYQYSAVRDGYAECIANLIRTLKAETISCHNLSDMKRRIEKEYFSHVIVSWDEYSEDKPYFEELARELNVLMVLDRVHKFKPQESRIHCIYKPFHALTVAAALNGQYADGGTRSRMTGFIAPDAGVLVVDDNRMNLKVIEGLLRPYKIKVHVAENGKRALKMLDTLRIDMVFMDHMMPEMDGIETFHELRRKPGSYFRNVPVIALTANAIGGARDMFLQEGFADYVTKPIEISELERVLFKFIPGTKIIRGSDIDISDETDENSENIGKITIEGVDTILGIGYCSGSTADYIDVIRIYHEIGTIRIGEIRGFFEKKDWNNYTILVHAVKSTSLNIGAVRLSNMAKRLESAGKENREGYILSNNDEMLEEYQRLLDAIRANKLIFPEEQEDSTEITPVRTEIDLDKLKEHLDTLDELLGSYEIETVEKHIDSLSSYSYDGRDVSDMLAPVSEKVGIFDFMGAEEELVKLREELMKT